MKKVENSPAKLSEGIVKSTREWLATHNTRVIFPKDPNTIEDVAPEVLTQDLSEFGY